MITYIKIVNEPQSLGMMWELITRGVYGRKKCGWKVKVLDKIWTMENYKNKQFRINGLTTDLLTENPRVGGSIPSRPTILAA